ncbi:hypothetical protein DSM112329_01933 [Paraconexibacter sp. AEG42_29]|uniref:DUF4131 domain-containing protein n=1 Tax=Paraconexibacter sp. AEG42_29 TaxID=2997339 RepID=A0AAU7ATX6_9ACTN
MRDAGTWLAIAAVAGVVTAGAVVRGWAVLVVSVVCALGFVVSGAEALSWLWLMAILPVLAAAALVGWGLRAVAGPRAWLAPGAFLVAGVIAAAGLAAQRAALDPVPDAVAARLPHDTGALSLLCFREAPVSQRRSARRQAQALTRAVRQRPDGLVTVVRVLAESPGTVREDLTVTELARESLQRASCSSPEADAVRRALG